MLHEIQQEIVPSPAPWKNEAYTKHRLGQVPRVVGKVLEVVTVNQRDLGQQ